MLHFENHLRYLEAYQQSLTLNSENLSRVELGSGGTVRKTLSAGEDSLVTELFPGYHQLEIWE